MKIDRREFIKNIAGAGALAVAATSCVRMPVFKNPDKGKPSSGGEHSPFYFVHITDQHVEKKRKGAEGYRRCIESVNALKPSPDLVVMGGDLAFDGNYSPKEKFVEEIKLYKGISDELNCPYFHCFGNHDVLGWHPRRKVSEDDPDFGKKCIMNMLNWESSYYSFDHKGWHFVILDCLKETKHPDKGTIYTPEIDEEQLEWLKADLGSANGMPTVAFIHIAAFCNIGQIEGNMERKAMDNGMVINNNKALRLILERHNVKALIQGHSHNIEQFYYNGVWYLTSTAASAAWWSGRWTGSKQGYTVFKCDKDKLSWENKTYELEYYLEPEDTLEQKKNKELDEFEAEQKRLRKEEINKGKTMNKKPVPKTHIPLKV